MVYIRVGEIPADSQEDIGRGEIRIDSYMRKNAGTSMGERVEISSVEVEEANAITLAPAEKGVMIQISDGDVFKKSLTGRYVPTNDIIVPKNPESGGSSFGDLFASVDSLDVGREDKDQYPVPESKVLDLRSEPDLEDKEELADGEQLEKFLTSTYSLVAMKLE